MGQFIISSVHWNVFLVRPRKQGAGQISTPLLLNTDYIEQTGYPGRGIKLNPGKYDVLHEWHDQLNVYAMNDIDSGLPVGSLVGDPKTTYEEYTFNLPMNFTIKSPENEPWIDKKYLELPYYDQISLLIFPQCAATDNQNPRFFFYAHFVCSEPFVSVRRPFLSDCI